MKIIGAVLCVLGTALLITYYLRLLAKRKEKYAASIEEKEKQLRQECERQLANMETQLKKKDNDVASLNQQLQQMRPTPPEQPCDLSLEERIQRLRSYFEINNHLNDDYRRFFAQLIRAAKYQALLKGINENFTAPMLDEIKDPGYTLDDTNLHYLLGKLIQLALVGIDYTQEFHTLRDGYDSLAINVAAGAISREEAAKKAKKASNNIYETETIIRVLNEMVQKLGLNDRDLIVKDTLLQE